MWKPFSVNCLRVAKKSWYSFIPNWKLGFTQNGCTRKKLSNIITPSAQMSTASVYKFSSVMQFNSSGAKYGEVPTKVLPKSSLLLTPKSQIFHIFPTSSTFYGLMSRWMTPSSCRYFSPCTTWTRRCLNYSPLSALSGFFWRYDRRLSFANSILMCTTPWMRLQ